jgi:hypothetical protein
MADDNTKRVERIAAVAVLDHERRIWTLPPPARHHHVLWAMCTVYPTGTATPDKFPQPADQGFITDAGRFVGRAEARFIATDSGQLLESAERSRDLFSEDLW